MSLPKRHRTHQLETESVLEFRSRLPSTWVYRTPSDDYGVDGEVEIFDDDGFATGKRFLVQLKATDEKNISRARRLRLPVKSANYFRRLNCPVLIVRYVAVRREIYSRWFHSFDPYLEGGTDKALSFKFSPSDLWGSERVSSLKAELNEFLRFERSTQPFPIELPIFFASDFPLAEKAAKLASELIDESTKYRNIVKLKVSGVPNEKPPSYVLFDKEKLHVVLANQTGACFHFSEGLSESLQESITNDIFVAIGLAIFSRGYVVESSNLFSGNALSSVLKKDTTLTTAVIASFIKSGQLPKAIDHMKALFMDSSDSAAAQAAMVLVIRWFSTSTDVEKELLLEALAEVSDFLEENSALELAATVQYNLGNINRSNEARVKTALRHYNRAKKLFPNYAKRSYWLSEVGGCLFILNRFSCASRFYEASLATESVPHIRALYADSLLYSGKLKQALVELTLYFDSEEKQAFEAEWHLKGLCLDSVIKAFKVDEQVPCRNDPDIDALIADDDESFVRYLKTRDILCGEVWYLLGLSVSKEERYQDAMVCFLMAAFGGFAPMDSWANALTCSFQEYNKGISAAIMQCAYNKLGQSFIFHFVETRSKGEESRSADLQLFLVELMQCLKDGKPDGSDFEIRFSIPDGDYDTFHGKNSQS